MTDNLAECLWPDKIVLDSASLSLSTANCSIQLQIPSCASAKNDLKKPHGPI